MNSFKSYKCFWWKHICLSCKEWAASSLCSPATWLKKKKKILYHNTLLPPGASRGSSQLIPHSRKQSAKTPWGRFLDRMQQPGRTICEPQHICGPDSCVQSLLLKRPDSDFFFFLLMCRLPTSGSHVFAHAICELRGHSLFWCWQGSLIDFWHRSYLQFRSNISITFICIPLYWASPTLALLLRCFLTGSGTISCCGWYVFHLFHMLEIKKKVVLYYCVGINQTSSCDRFWDVP